MSTLTLDPLELYLKYAPKEEDPETIAYAKECIDKCKKIQWLKGKKNL